MLGTMTEQWKVATESWTAFADQAAGNIQSAFAEFLFDPFAEGVQGMVKGFADAIRQMIAQYIALQAIRGIGTELVGKGNAFLGGVGTVLQGRGSGGPVSGGTPYMVGEKCPEVFVPRSSGNIIPNGAGMGVNITQHFDMRGVDAERVASMLPAWGNRVKSETVAVVLDLQRRGRMS